MLQAFGTNLCWTATPSSDVFNSAHVQQTSESTVSTYWPRPYMGRKPAKKMSTDNISPLYVDREKVARPLQGTNLKGMPMFGDPWS